MPVAALESPEEELDEFVEAPLFDLLKVPLIGRFLEWRHARTLLQIPVLAISIVMILEGLFGPTLSPKNPATVLTWVHFRGALVLALLCVGNLFCLACPFMLVRNAMRRFITPRFNWPRSLRNKWIAVTLFALVLFTYELFSLWSSPWLTAWVIVGYFLAVLVVDGLFKHATFCKYICPIGQFNFIAATASPLEVSVRDQEVCSTCGTKDCIRGRRAPSSDLVVLQRGCELALFQPAKVGNMDCTFCLDCVHACPHDNVGILSRLPAGELMTDPPRSGIGLFSRRNDIAALTIVFCFGALMNAFGMVSPVYVVEALLGRWMHVSSEAPELGVLFVLFLIVEPAVLLGLASWVTRAWAGVKRGWLAIAVRYTYCAGAAGLRHVAGSLWLPLLYRPLHDRSRHPERVRQIWDGRFSANRTGRWWGCPKTVVEPLEFGFLLLGLAGSMAVAWRLAEDDSEEHTARAFAPWAVVSVILFAASVWLMMQPMDMRATMMAG